MNVRNFFSESIMNVNYVYKRSGQPPEVIGNHGTQINPTPTSDWLDLICPEKRTEKEAGKFE